MAARRRGSTRSVRLLFESMRIPVVATIPSDATSPFAGSTVVGVAWLTFRTFDAGEAIPKQHDHARPLARWLEQLGGRRPSAALPDVFESETGVREVMVPLDILGKLPPDTIIAVDWEFAPAR
jgi:hypothetical protein